jgi:hypothetical protein
MTWLTTALSFLKTAWPYISLVLSLLGGVHAASADAKIPTGPETSLTQQADRATHVYGVGALAAAAGVAGLTGIGINHGKLKASPSVAPAGVDQVLHQLQIAYAAMVEEEGAGPDLADLNAIIIKRKARPAPTPQAQGKPS